MLEELKKKLFFTKFRIFAAKAGQSGKNNGI